MLDVIERTSKIDMYENKAEKYSALTPDIRIHYHTVFKWLMQIFITQLRLKTILKAICLALNNQHNKLNSQRQLFIYV